MPITPSTVVRLCSVPFDNSQKNVIRFANRAEQASYFQAAARHTYTEFTYQRKDNVIRVPEHVDKLWDINYVMYDNNAFPGRWFYAFITRLEYVNENLTYVHIDTDVYQTWFLDCNFLPSFVEREHEEFE